MSNCKTLQGVFSRRRIFFHSAYCSNRCFWPKGACSNDAAISRSISSVKRPENSSGTNFARYCTSFFESLSYHKRCLLTTNWHDLFNQLFMRSVNDRGKITQARLQGKGVTRVHVLILHRLRHVLKVTVLTNVLGV